MGLVKIESVVVYLKNEVENKEISVSGYIIFPNEQNEENCHYSSLK
jgi:hypothetical protein